MNKRRRLPLAQTPRIAYLMALRGVLPFRYAGIKPA
ncbi:MAG: hypothetical protein RL490_541 [Pseudomonadota bacterium]|jgi:hypothetical protein